MNNETFLMDIELRATPLKRTDYLLLGTKAVDRLRQLGECNADIPSGVSTMQAGTALILVSWARYAITERVAKTLSTNL